MRGFWTILFILSGVPAYALEAKITTAPNVPSFISRTMPEMVVVTPTATQSQYMDYRDGSQLWETFIVAQLLPHLRSQYRIKSRSVPISDRMRLSWVSIDRDSGPGAQTS